MARRRKTPNPKHDYMESKHNAMILVNNIKIFTFIFRGRIEQGIQYTINDRRLTRIIFTKDANNSI